MSVGANGDADFRVALINVLRGPVYRDEREGLWRQLLAAAPPHRRLRRGSRHGPRRRRGQGLRVPALEHRRGRPGRSATTDTARRALSYPVSLLLALLRRRLAEFDATSSDARLVLSQRRHRRMLRDFLRDQPNEARLIDRIDAPHQAGGRPRLPARAARPARPLRGPPHPRGVRRRAVAGRLRPPPGAIR